MERRRARLIGQVLLLGKELSSCHYGLRDGEWNGIVARR